MGRYVNITSRLNAEMVDRMAEAWPIVSARTYRAMKMRGLDNATLAVKRSCIHQLELKHPRVYDRVRAAAGNKQT